MGASCDLGGLRGGSQGGLALFRSLVVIASRPALGDEVPPVAASNANTKADAGAGVGANAKRPKKLTPRPEEPAEDRAARIARLRQVYRGSASEWPRPDVDPGVEWVELGLLPKVSHPDINPPTEAKIALGKMLFLRPSPVGERADRPRIVPRPRPRLGRLPDDLVRARPPGRRAKLTRVVTNIGQLRSPVLGRPGGLARRSGPSRDSEPEGDARPARGNGSGRSQGSRLSRSVPGGIRVGRRDSRLGRPGACCVRANPGRRPQQVRHLSQGELQGRSRTRRSPGSTCSEGPRVARTATMGQTSATASSMTSA